MAKAFAGSREKRCGAPESDFSFERYSSANAASSIIIRFPEPGPRDGEEVNAARAVDPGLKRSARLSARSPFRPGQRWISVRISGSLRSVSRNRACSSTRWRPSGPAFFSHFLWRGGRRSSWRPLPYGLIGRPSTFCRSPISRFAFPFGITGCAGTVWGTRPTSCKRSSKRHVTSSSSFREEEMSARYRLPFGDQSPNDYFLRYLRDLDGVDALLNLGRHQAISPPDQRGRRHDVLRTLYCLRKTHRVAD